MNATLKEFLASRLPFPGLVGWGAFLEEHSIFQQSYVDWLSPNRIEQTLTRLNKFAENRTLMDTKPERLVWKFENMCLHFACRNDGAVLMLAVENTLQAPSLALASVLEEFLRANAG